MRQPCEPLPAVGLKGFSLGQSIIGTWINNASAPTAYVFSADIAAASDKRPSLRVSTYFSDVES